MKQILALNGSPRKKGNTHYLLDYFLKGAQKHKNYIDSIHVSDLDLQYCQGCLRCNLLGYCSIKHDDWPVISNKIQEADVLVFATPIYFHHVTAQLKTLIDRFRSFIHVAITETGLQHTPGKRWKKDIVLLLTMGSSDEGEAVQTIDMFRFIARTMGTNNSLHVLKGRRLAVSGQVVKTPDELAQLYPKLHLPTELAKEDAVRNKKLLEDCSRLGDKIAKKKE
jgi:multimeric flavodoxin WrbA